MTYEGRHATAEQLADWMIAGEDVLVIEYRDEDARAIAVEVMAELDRRGVGHRYDRGNRRLAAVGADGMNVGRLLLSTGGELIPGAHHVVGPEDAVKRCQTLRAAA